MGLNYDEHHHGHENLKGKKLGISILLNLLITIAQVIGGIISGSLSLLSDALHNFSDVISLIISYIADLLTQKQYTPRQTFGYKRAEILAAMINATTLLVIAVMLVKEAISRLQQPVTIDSLWVILLAALSIFVNGGSVLLLKRDAAENMNIKSAYLHLFTDMMTSVAVLLGGIGMQYFKMFWVDSVLSILISVYLVYSSWGLLLQTLRILMQFTPPEIDCHAIEQKVLHSIPSIKNLHHMHVWQLNDKEIHFEAHLDFHDDRKLSETTVIIEELSHLLREQFNITHTVLQQEFDTDDAKDIIVDESKATCSK